MGAILKTLTYNFIKFLGRAEPEECWYRARETCKHALLLHPKSHPDKHYCRYTYFFRTVIISYMQHLQSIYQ